MLGSCLREMVSGEVCSCCCRSDVVGRYLESCIQVPIQVTEQEGGIDGCHIAVITTRKRVMRPRLPVGARWAVAAAEGSWNM